MTGNNKSINGNKVVRKILLVEPNYKNKYPPLGLMKISTYHKMLGDDVVFFKGMSKDLRDKQWDRIYVSTLFTFYMREIIKTILYYKRSVKNTQQFIIGGIAASLLPEKIFEETGLQPVIGLLDKPGILDDNEIIVDNLIPDYSILDEINYIYPSKDAYFAYTTRGCIRKCNFCAVPKLEPKYKSFISIKDQIGEIERKYGPKKDLLLLDNNVLASEHFKEIIDEIKELGFTRDSVYYPPNELEFWISKVRNEEIDKVYAVEKIRPLLYQLRRKIQRYKNVLRIFYDVLEKYHFELDGNEIPLDNLEGLCNDLMPLYNKYRNKAAKKRYIDFNQGIDARLLDEEKMKLLSEVAIHPLRIAFDNIEIKEIYIEKIKLANKYQIKELSNYILYNFKDKPEDLYERLKINVELNDNLKCKIYSFPMRYSPVELIDRSYIGLNWCPKYLRAINKIINVTKGIVAPGKDFFEKAYGKDLDEYFKILLMPDDYILNRFERERDGSVVQWWSELSNLPETKKKLAIEIIKNADFSMLPLEILLDDDIINVLKHYRKDGGKYQISIENFRQFAINV